MTGEGPSRPSGGGDAHWQGSSGGLNLPRMSNRLPVGPGSRGGTFHADTAGYFRRWRAAHPEYAERERQRSRERKAKYREARTQDQITFTEACLATIAAEVMDVGVTRVANAMFLNHRTVGKWLSGDFMHITSDAVDAAVLRYGTKAITRTLKTVGREEYEQLVRAAASRPKRWQNQWGVLTPEEEVRIAAMIEAGMGLTAIAKETGRGKSAIWRRIVRARAAAQTRA